MDLTDWLRRAFKDSGLTGKALEARTEELGLKVPQPTISRIIAGRHDPAFSKVVVLAKALGRGDILDFERGENAQYRDLSDDEATILAALPLAPQKSKKKPNLLKDHAGISPEAKSVIDRLCLIEASGSSSPQLIAAIESILDLVAPNANPDGYSGLKQLKAE